MKCAHALLAAALVGTVAASSEVEQTRDVGHGFRMVAKSQQAGPGAFEGFAHCRYLFYKDIELVRYDSYSVAPSGRYALFQDAPTGAVVLFVSANSQRRVVAKFSGSLARDYVWREKQDEATIEFENRASLRISLSAP